jgi:hypothetical protein
MNVTTAEMEELAHRWFRVDATMFTNGIGANSLSFMAGQEDAGTMIEFNLAGKENSLDSGVTRSAV